MSQHSPFPSSNRTLSFARNGHSPHASGTPGSSGLDGQPRPTDVDPSILHSFGNASSIASGFLGDLDIANPSSVQTTMGPPDDRARFAGLEYDRLFHFYHDQDEPWNQEKSRVRGQYDPLPSSFTGFRDTVAPSECETSIGPGTLQSDSGYGSQARQSVGIPSVYGEVDRSSEAIMNQLAGFQMPSESIHGSSQVHDVNHLGHSWNQVTLGRPDGVQANNTPKFQCQHCPKTFRSQSDHKKHTARHEKPHKCPERGCSKATKGFGTINDLERHLKSVHRKDGTRYRCHHGSCLTKAKDWPRPDNFRSHLKKIHNISLEAGDSLEDYIYRSVNPEILSNVGVSLELVPPAVHESPAPHSWSQLERDTHVHRSGIGGSSEEILLDRRDVYLPPPAHPRFTNTSGLDNHDASSSSGFRYSRSRLEPQQDHDRDLVEDDNVLHVTSDRHQDLPRSREMAHQVVPSEENVEYVRPDDLNNASHGALEPASPAEDPETEAIVLDEDDEVGASDGIDSNDDDFQVKSLSSPGTATKLPESVNKFDPVAVEDGAKRHQQQAVTGGLEDNGSDSDDLVKPGTPLPLGEAFASLSEELDETDPERAEAAFQKLMFKLGDTRMEKLLRTHGYVKPKGPQPRQKSASQQLPIACLEPGCPKSFNRPCEMKKHLKRHEKPYGCTQCQKRFGSKNDWKRHENSQHFQHEIWKCEEKLNTPLSDTCNKVCHRRETFKQHLVSHHGIDSQRLEDKLDRCRIGRLGEARFWCGFCKDVIELETEKNAHDACNARYNHIDDHYSGRNGAVKREAGEWQFGDSDAAEAETKVPPQGDEAKEEMAALPQVSELRKRSRHGSGPTPKRARFSPPREDIMWYCCQCNNPWSFANNPSCISCPRHMRCGDCRVEEIEPTEAGPSGDAE